ncbi:glycosyltransferase family 2 protein [Noviherbaspirillum galbum]|uniref:Glycosyltransferase n=1 Tax=Noviherbaspirillum galbum TaxID=2709383 RepID=A0A6B3SPF0_9BURK|nr:glycosyltransferase family 2 protein [Noviherbaspirillum galbum]NEX62388.1 glycosyltransferase [Noviherbaspirillum galbum]
MRNSAALRISEDIETSAVPLLLPEEAIVAPPPAAVPSRRYIPVRNKFVLAWAFSLSWTLFSWYFGQGWIDELATHIGTLPAYLVVFGIAIIPGFMNAFLVVSLLLDRRPPRKPLDLPYPELTILIAAYMEEANILSTLESIEKQNYPGVLQVIVINDGSTDNTGPLVRAARKDYRWLRLIDLRRNIGKARALNVGLGEASYEIVVTIDGDSYLHKDALKNIVERYMTDPCKTSAVAGCVLVRNSRRNWITKMQEWDYFHGIAAIKRIQSLFHGTLVAQGAFSLYSRRVLREVGGWPNCVGEDIVLTWAMLKAGYRIGHCEDALLFTNVPETLSIFVRQRQRWSRGMLEAFKCHPQILTTRRMATAFIYWNVLFPFLDLIYTVAFIPGIVLACFGCYWIAGPMTLALLPLTFIINYLMFRNGKELFDRMGLKVRRNRQGFLLYTLAYSLLLQPACCLGYVSELLKLKKTWGTK